jgi:hypothetical protein
MQNPMLLKDLLYSMDLNDILKDGMKTIPLIAEYSLMIRNCS